MTATAQEAIFAITQLTADGNSDAFVCGGANGIANQTCPIQLQVYGSFGGGTINIGVSLDGGTTYDLAADSGGTSVAFTQDIVQLIELVPGSQFRLQLTGATTPTIDAFLCGNIVKAAA